MNTATDERRGAFLLGGAIPVISFRLYLTQIIYIFTYENEQPQFEDYYINNNAD